MRPGMRLMRRFTVAGKFGVIAILLLVPLCMLMATAFRESTDQLAATRRERQGLACIDPMVRLVLGLSQARTLAGSSPDSAPPLGAESWSSFARQVDDAVVGAADGEFDVTGDWARLRLQLRDAYAGDITAEVRESRADAAARATHQLIKKVSDLSGLTLDPRLDSHYLALTMIDGMPRLVMAVADAQRQRRLGVADMDLGVSASDFRDAGRQITVDLTTATAASSWPGLRGQLNTESWALNTAVNRYLNTLSNSTGTTSGSTSTGTASGGTDKQPATRDDDSAEVSALVNAAAALNAAVVDGLDEVLQRREAEQMEQRNQPLILTLAALLVVFYLLTALFRAITRDVRVVLEDIRGVTSAAVYEEQPLSGSDEFGEMSRAVVFARDRITSLVGALKYQATHDELTSLANRTLFTEKLEAALEADSGQGAIAVALIDLDGFKAVNDSFGHDFGDRLLRNVGARIHRAAPRRSVIARLSSDEFAVLVTDPREMQRPSEVIHRIEEALAQPVDIEGRLIRVQAGIGVATARPGNGTKALEVFRNADLALSYAKNRGTGHRVTFEPAMHDQTRERTELSGQLIGVAERGELSLSYQPIVDLHTGYMHGIEALVRWNHPDRGEVRPDVFIPLAEATGQIRAIGGWVLDEACRQLARWREEFPDAYPLVLEVNLAADQLTDQNLVSDVLTCLQGTGIDPANLVLEITESAVLEDVDTALMRLGQLSAMGVQTALDDFGTGYSSLSYLRRLPANTFKIDKSFLEDASEDGRALLRGIVELGRGQGMQIIVEGIEDVEQADLVRGLGAHLGQGHLWAPALQPEQITRIISAGGHMPTIRSASVEVRGQVPTPRAPRNWPAAGVPLRSRSGPAVEGDQLPDSR